MNTALIIVGAMGFGAILVSVYVFLVAARNYVSRDGRPGRRDSAYFVNRASADRRAAQTVSFPLNLNGILIEEDRRSGRERRTAHA